MKACLRKLIRLSAYGLGILLGLIALYFGSAWLLSRIAVNKDAVPPQEAGVSIYIRTNGVHTDIVVPLRNEIRDWGQTFSLPDTGLHYAGFGWGDKGFYLQTPGWADLKFSVAFKALFHLGSTAMHISFSKEMTIGASCREIRISAAQYRKLTDYLEQSFRPDEQGRMIRIPFGNAGYGRDDVFYEARGVYDLFHTCNTWANNALKACDQRACLWTPLDKGIFYQYRDR